MGRDKKKKRASATHGAATTPPKPKRVLDLMELKALYDEQVTFLIDSSESFDEGKTREAKRLALAIRVLVHDTGMSLSLLKQIGLKKDFYDSSRNVGNVTTPVVNAIAPISLVGRLSHNPLHFYSPHFGNPTPEKMVTFDSWWHMPIIIDKETKIFSRRDLVLAFSNQDGGAHVAPEFDESFYKLTRENSVQDRFVDNRFVAIGPQPKLNTKEFVEVITDTPPGPPPTSPAHYTIRQIAHEVLVSISYPQNGYIFGTYAGQGLDFQVEYQHERGTTMVAQGTFSLFTNPDGSAK